MTDNGTSGPISDLFISGEELQTSCELMESRGFNCLVKVKRQGRWFLLKGLKPEYRNQQVFLELLKKEYELMVQLDHPNIVKAFSKEMNEEFGPCIVMEYIDGMTLDKFLEGKPSGQARRKVLDQLIDALGYIHGKQIVHRDLKPSNIFITHNGNNVKIIDFGLSDADDYAILKQTAGTLYYMAPEQKQGRCGMGLVNICKSDIYSFGMLLRELFPHRYCGIAYKCTRENPAKRFPNMEAVRKAMERSDRWRRRIPVMVMMALMVPLIFFATRSVNTAEMFETMPSGFTPDQKIYFGEVDWTINTMLHPIVEDAQKGNEYKEVLLARLTKTSADIKTKSNEWAMLYPSDSQEWLTFVTQIGNALHGKERKVIDRINGNCKSFVEEYQKHRIDQAAYDSLEWLISPLVMSPSFTEINTTMAMGVLDVLERGRYKGVESGLCWGMLHHPTVNGRHISCDLFDNRFVIGDLHPNTTYFVRAYLTSSAGTTYGNELAFTTLPSDAIVAMEQGALSGLFSVSESRQVRFSRGNLQYQASTGMWRFAEYQYDFIGKDNEKISETYDGCIDLFGWATSGYDHGAVNWQPWSDHKDSQSNVLHYAYGKALCDLDEQTGKADWGYNAIVNGGNREHLWRTPSKEEWVYLFFVRNTASGVRFAKACVNGVNGLVLLPDNWKVATYQLNSVNVTNIGYSNNVINLNDWQCVLEPAGAVFLPEAGARTIDGVYLTLGTYHTSSAALEDVYGVSFGNDNLMIRAEGHRGDGLSVRLVQEVE